MPATTGEPILHAVLTDLGAREPVVPRLIADLQGIEGGDFPAWPSTRLPKPL